MSTDLSHNATVPLWGFIVIIAVGSIIIVGSVFFGLRYYISHHDSDNDSIRNDPETVRRVTVRRGRIVPQSHYMSLTGSRFGVGAFGEDSRSGARSMSPFEWWNNVHSRSNSQMSQVKVGRHQTPEPTTARTTNFSRPALGMPSPSIASLPQIIETSPHQSLISSHQSKHSIFSEKAPSVVHSELGAPRSPASMTGFGSRANSHADVSSTISEEPDHRSAMKRQRSQSRNPLPTHTRTPPRSRSLPRSPRPADNVVEQTVPPISKRPSAMQTDRTIFLNTSERRPSSTNPERKSLNKPLPSTHCPDRRQSLPRSPRRSSSTLNSIKSYRAPGDADHVTGQLSNASVQALPQMKPTDHSQAYWESRHDLQPVRKKSQKGKVLRKKSLQRAERTSMVN
jgi:hypothetical protein